MSSARRKLLAKPPVVSVGCGCRRPKLSNMFTPRPKSKFANYHKPPTTHQYSSSSSWEGCGLSFTGDGDSDDNSTTTFSPITTTDVSPPPPCPQLNHDDPSVSFRKQLVPCGCSTALKRGASARASASNVGCSSTAGSRRIGESVAVVKDSDDPYVDFQHSILQMIIEKEIYSKEDLRELLNCFLSLNSPYHHQIIIRAFMEIWNRVFARANGT